MYRHHRMRVDVMVAEDHIMPYGDKLQATSESKRRELALRLSDVSKYLKKQDETSTSTNEKPSQ